MPSRRYRPWNLPESAATPEPLVLGRRAALVAAGLAGLIAGPAAAQRATPMTAQAAAPALPEHTRNLRFRPGRDLTAEREAIIYNNFYEFGSHKGIWPEAQRLPLRPWRLRVDGLVASPREFEIDDLLRTMPIEQRVYRLRCVEAWAMTVPWSGFQLSELLRVVEPQAGARFVAFETAAIPTVMPGLRQSWYPWPHVEACTIEEAAHELTFMPVGMYGKPLTPQNGGPLRVVLPWKYGFKSGKSVARVTFTDRMPQTFWPRIQPAEYGFWANVNPQVPHPRWSQATERLLGSGERVPTQLFNGYGEFVAGLYAGLQAERLWV